MAPVLTIALLALGLDAHVGGSGRGGGLFDDIPTVERDDGFTGGLAQHRRMGEGDWVLVLSPPSPNPDDVPPMRFGGHETVAACRRFQTSMLESLRTEQPGPALDQARGMIRDGRCVRGTPVNGDWDR